MRVLPKTISHEKLIDHTQESSASWIERCAETFTKNISYQKCAASWATTSTSASVRLSRWIWSTTSRNEFQYERTFSLNILCILLLIFFFLFNFCFLSLIWFVSHYRTRSSLETEHRCAVECFDFQREMRTRIAYKYFRLKTL